MIRGTSTRKGRKLALKLGPYLDRDGGIERDIVCSLITRHAASLQRLAIVECNEPMTERQMLRHEASETAHSQRLAELVPLLGLDISGAALTLEVGGDPRGYVVKIGVPCETPHGGDTWGRGGLFCVGD